MLGSKYAEKRRQKKRQKKSAEDQGADPRADASALPQAHPQDEQGSSLGEPYFPTEQEAIDLNQAAIAQWHRLYGDSPEWGGVLKPNELKSALASAQQHYAYGPEEDEGERLTQALGKMAWRIAGNQVFANGNKRTAIWLTRHALDQNGLGHLSPVDQEDPEFADHLIAQDSYGANLPEGLGDQERANYLSQQRGQLEQEYLDSWRDRYQRGGMDPSYEARYPEGTYLYPKESNILDPVHDALDARVWLHPGAPMPRLRPEHRSWIIETIFTALEKHGYDGMEKWLSLILTGSLTTYQYSDESDCDVSLFIDTQVFPEWSRADMIGIMVAEIDGTTLPGTPHPMQDFVVAQGIEKTDLYKPGLRSGYDIIAEQWVEPPDRSRVHDVEHEMNQAYTVALENADKMDRLLTFEPQKAPLFYHQVHRRRMRDMQAGKGDYSPSNVTYKLLNNRGYFKRIHDLTGEYIS